MNIPSNILEVSTSQMVQNNYCLIIINFLEEKVNFNQNLENTVCSEILEDFLLFCIRILKYRC